MKLEVISAGQCQVRLDTRLSQDNRANHNTSTHHAKTRHNRPTPSYANSRQVLVNKPQVNKHDFWTEVRNDMFQSCMRTLQRI